MPAHRILTTFMRGSAPPLLCGVQRHRFYTVFSATARGQVLVIFLVGGVMTNEYLGGVCFRVRAGIPLAARDLGP
jgi:hypothetical protein